MKISKVLLPSLLFFTLALNPGITSAADTSWAAWDETLKASVSDEGFVDYNAIDNVNQIDGVVSLIANTDIETLTSNTEKLTFYINSYNALVIKAILDGKSPSNIFSRISFFKGQEYNVAGQELNLNDLEHKVIRPLKEARIHFALVCASRSCPKLLNTIYTTDALDQQLDEATSEFINNIDKNHFDRKSKTAHLSKIFEWFTEDFELEGKSVLDFVAHYIDDEELAVQLVQNDYEIEHNKYFWTLNGSFNN